MEERDDSLERKAVRSSWPVRRRRLGEECDDLSAETAAAERIAMMWSLALEAWRMAAEGRGANGGRRHPTCRPSGDVRPHLASSSDLRASAFR
jgi:hypothetical protein